MTRYHAFEVHSLRNLGSPWNRDCPDCSTTFASVQSTGVCPYCQLVFDVDCDGKLLRRLRRIGDPAPSAVEQGIGVVRKFLRFLAAAKITSEEFNDALLCFWINLSRECWIPCALEIPGEVAGNFSRYLDEYLPPLDYKPPRRPFMDTPFGWDCIEQKKLELEPIYREIHRFWSRQSEERGITKR